MRPRISAVEPDGLLFADGRGCPPMRSYLQPVTRTCAPRHAYYLVTRSLTGCGMYGASTRRESGVLCGVRATILGSGSWAVFWSVLGTSDQGLRGGIDELRGRLVSRTENRGSLLTSCCLLSRRHLSS